MSEWCQNKSCPQKKNQNQIRGSKGAKYYQSNKVSGYYVYWCSMGCRETWWQDHKDTCINAVGFIDKQILPLDDAWYVEYKYDWRTEEQISQGHSWCTIDDTQAKELAITLGLAS